jgi:hypothetical protein
MVPAEVSKKPTPTTKAIELPPMLKNANLNDVVLRAAKSSTTQEDITLADSVAGVELARLPVLQLRMLCARWKLKKYRKAKKEGILELIATHQKMRQPGFLDDSLFSKSTDIKHRNKKAKLTKVPGSNEKKAESLKDVAASMIAAFTHNAKRIEKSRLEESIGTVMMHLLSLPDGEKGERARTFFNKQIKESQERVEYLKEWFLENPSPSKK